MGNVFGKKDIRTPSEIHKEEQDLRERRLKAAGEPLAPTHGRAYGALAVADPPMVMIPVSVGGIESTVLHPFLPGDMLPPDVWESLKEDASQYKVSEEELNQLWLRFCHPDDVTSVGTVSVAKVCEEFDPMYRRLLRRLLMARAGPHPRILYEDMVRWILEVCSWDYGTLLLQSLKVIRDFPAINVTAMRATARYVAGDLGQDLPDFSRTLLGLLSPDEGLGPFHSTLAFVDLSLRYPCLVHPILAAQFALQKQFLGRARWKALREDASTALFPPTWTAAHALAMSARVLMLESVSLEATPFSFGTPGTEVDAPLRLSTASLGGKSRRGLSKKSSLSVSSSSSSSSSSSNFLSISSPSKASKRHVEAIGKASKLADLNGRGGGDDNSSSSSSSRAKSRSRSRSRRGSFSSVASSVGDVREGRGVEMAQERGVKRAGVGAAHRINSNNLSVRKISSPPITLELDSPADATPHASPAAASASASATAAAAYNAAYASEYQSQVAAQRVAIEVESRQPWGEAADVAMDEAALARRLQAERVRSVGEEFIGEGGGGGESAYGGLGLDLDGAGGASGSTGGPRLFSAVAASGGAGGGGGGGRGGQEGVPITSIQTFYEEADSKGNDNGGKARASRATADFLALKGSIDASTAAQKERRESLGKGGGGMLSPSPPPPHPSYGVGSTAKGYAEASAARGEAERQGQVEAGLRAKEAWHGGGLVTTPLLGGAGGRGGLTTSPQQQQAQEKVARRASLVRTPPPGLPSSTALALTAASLRLEADVAQSGGGGRKQQGAVVAGDANANTASATLPTSTDLVVMAPGDGEVSTTSSPSNGGKQLKKAPHIRPAFSIKENQMLSAGNDVVQAMEDILYSYPGGDALRERGDISHIPLLSLSTQGNIFSLATAAPPTIVPGPRPMGTLGHRLGYYTTLTDLFRMLDGVPESEQLAVANRIIGDAVAKRMIIPATIPPLKKGEDPVSEVEQAAALAKWIAMPIEMRNKQEIKARMADAGAEAKRDAAEKAAIAMGMAAGVGEEVEEETAAAAAAAAAVEEEAGKREAAEGGGGEEEGKGKEEGSDGGGGGGEKETTTKKQQPPPPSRRLKANPPPPPPPSSTTTTIDPLDGGMSKREMRIARAAMRNTVENLGQVLAVLPQESQVELLSMCVATGGVGYETKERDMGWTGVDTRVRLAAFAMSELMGGNTRAKRARAVLANTDKTLPIPIPRRVHPYILSHPRPPLAPKDTQHSPHLYPGGRAAGGGGGGVVVGVGAGAGFYTFSSPGLSAYSSSMQHVDHLPPPTNPPLALSSLEISRLVLRHSTTGALDTAGVVLLPCLLCKRDIRMVTPPVDVAALAAKEDAEHIAATGFSLGELGREATAVSAARLATAASNSLGGGGKGGYAGAGTGSGAGGASSHRRDSGHMFGQSAGGGVGGGKGGGGSSTVFLASTRPMSPANSSSTLILPMVQTAFGSVPMTFQREPSSLAAEALVEAEVTQAMTGYRKGGVGKRRAPGSSTSSRSLTSSSNSVLTGGGGEGGGLSFLTAGVDQQEQQQQQQQQLGSVHNPHFRSLASNLTLASRKHASCGDEVHAAGLGEASGPVVAQRGEDDRYLRLVHLGRDGKPHRRRHYHAHVTRDPLKSSGAGGLGLAHNTTSVLTAMARKGAEADVVTEMVGDVLLKVKALERDEREVLEALAKEAGREFNGSPAIGEGKVKALRSDTSMAAVISQMEAQFQKEDEMEDLAVKVIVQEQALAELVEKNEGREKARQEYLETLEEEEEGHNDEEEEEDDDDFFDGGSAAGGSVSSYGGGSATGSATSATSAMSYHRRKKGGRRGGGKNGGGGGGGGGLNSFSQQRMVLSNSSSSLASMDSFTGRSFGGVGSSNNPAFNQASQVDFLLAQTPKGFSGGGSATGSVRSRSSSPLKAAGPSQHHLILSSASAVSATSSRGLSPPSRRIGGGGSSSSSSVGRGRGSKSPRRRNGSPSPPPPTPPPKPFNLVEEAKRAMAVKETPTQIRQREAEAAEIERREALLTSRPSMTRGETWHGAKPHHPLTAQAIKNGMKVDPDAEEGGGGAIVVSGAGAGAGAGAGGGALVTMPGSNSKPPLNAGATFPTGVGGTPGPPQPAAFAGTGGGAAALIPGGGGGGGMVTRGSGAERPSSSSSSSSSSPLPPPPSHPLEKSHLQNTGFCHECDDYIRRSLAEQFGYKVAGVVMKAATVQESTQEEVEREITKAALEALPTAKRRVPMDPKLGAGPLDRAKLLKREKVAAKAREESAAQRSTAFAAHAAHTSHVNSTLVPNEPLARQVRYVAYGDKWVEDYDDETGRTFYYNVVDGARQWAKPPVQHWDLAEGAYTPLTPPTVFPKTNEGELEAARAEKDRLEKATARALAQGRVIYERQQGLGPRSLAGEDVGPASAKVLPGSFRVTQRGRE